MCPAHAIASEAASYTIGYIIRRYHVYKNVWLSYIGEVLYCCCDERSAEEPFRSGTAAKQNQNVYSLEVLVKRHKLIKSQDAGLTRAAMTNLQMKISVAVELKSLSP